MSKKRSNTRSKFQTSRTVITAVRNAPSELITTTMRTAEKTHGEQSAQQSEQLISTEQKFTFCFAGFDSIFVFELTVMFFKVMARVDAKPVPGSDPTFPRLSHMYTVLYMQIHQHQISLHFHFIRYSPID